MEDWGARRDRLAKVLAESAEVVNILPDRTTQWDISDDIRAALERDDEVKRLIDMAGDWIETDPSLRSTACIEVALDHAKELDAEVIALRQREADLADQVDYWMGKEQLASKRVEELERTARKFGVVQHELSQRSEAAEAKLAKVVAILSAVSLQDDTESICLRALAAAKGE